MRISALNRQRFCVCQLNEIGVRHDEETSTNEGKNNVERGIVIGSRVGNVQVRREVRAARGLQRTSRLTRYWI